MAAPLGTHSFLPPAGSPPPPPDPVRPGKTWHGEPDARFLAACGVLMYSRKGYERAGTRRHPRADLPARAGYTRAMGRFGVFRVVSRSSACRRIGEPDARLSGLVLAACGALMCAHMQGNERAGTRRHGFRKPLWAAYRSVSAGRIAQRQVRALTKAEPSPSDTRPP
jgi:hypothetical protein